MRRHDPCGAKLASASNPAEIFVYPNPANDIVNIEFYSPEEGNYSLALFDLTGRMVLNTEGATFAEGNRILLPVSNIAQGIYSIRLAVGDNSSLTRLVISK